jgi:tRNA A37 N6-isopentenylltransferase MiaA
VTETPTQNPTDHDLLIRIDTRMETMLRDFAEFKTKTAEEIGRLWREKSSVSHCADHERSTSEDIGRLWREKSSQKSSEDHEKRIREMERRVWLAMGGLTLLSLALHYWK